MSKSTANLRTPASAKFTVLNHIRTAIRRGVLQPGQAIRERELAEACDVSRTAIREALVTLVADGTLVREHGHSPIVRQFTREEIWAHHQIREALEGLAAGLAATRHDQVRFHAAIRDVAGRLNEASVNGDTEGYLQANYDFHALIVAMSGNPFIQEHIDQSHATQLRMQAARFLDDEGMQHSQRGHQEIMDAILRGESEMAEAAMRAHIRDTRRAFFDMPDILFKSGDVAAQPAFTRKVGRPAKA